jgi:transcriptional regulator GlxA family with amidase domain
MKFTLIISLLCLNFIVFGQNTTIDAKAKRQQEMMAIATAKPKIPIKTIGILIYDGYQTLDAMGPYEVLKSIPSVQVFFVAKQKGLVSNQRNLKMQVDTSISEVKNLDILVIPGGLLETFKISQDTVVLNWIKAIDKTSIYTTSVCTGAWILGSTGLLKGKNVTTNWYRAEEMMTMYGAHFKQERYLQDGKYWTSAGVSAGIDMSLAIVNDLMGEKYTQAVMLNFEYDPKPPVKGGSVENTDELVIDMMRSMYDKGLLPLIEKAKKQ